MGGFDLIYRGKEIGIGSATSYTTMLGCKNNRIENIKKLARATAFRLAKEYQEKNKAVDSTKKIENKFTIKTSTKIDRSKQPQKTNTIDSRKSNSLFTQMLNSFPLQLNNRRNTFPSIGLKSKRRKSESSSILIGCSHFLSQFSYHINQIYSS